MKHVHQADVNIHFDIPAKELESLVEKITDAGLTLIAASTAAYIVKRLIAPS